MQQVPAETGNDPVGIEHFGAIVGRNTADNLLRRRRSSIMCSCPPWPT